MKCKCFIYWLNALRLFLPISSNLYWFIFQCIVCDMRVLGIGVTCISLATSILWIVHMQLKSIAIELKWEFTLLTNTIQISGKSLIPYVELQANRSWADWHTPALMYIAHAITNRSHKTHCWNISKALEMNLKNKFVRYLACCGIEIHRKYPIQCNMHQLAVKKEFELFFFYCISNSRQQIEAVCIWDVDWCSFRKTWIIHMKSNVCIGPNQSNQSRIQWINSNMHMNEMECVRCTYE